MVDLNPRVDEYIQKAKKWPQELAKLRELVLESGLNEEFKWYQPCYTFQSRNVIILSEYKDFCSLAFFNGALLKDEKGLLARPGNVQAGRQLRFTSVQEIEKADPIIRAYIDEAIEVEKAGLKVVPKKTEDYEVPVEFQNKLEKDPALRTAFEALTPGRQRGYLFYFAAPKQSKTREARIEKYVQQILDGKGMNDR